MSVTGSLGLQYPVAPGGIVLPAGAVPLSASSGIVTFEDTAGQALSPLVPVGATPLWWDVRTTVDMVGAPDGVYMNLGTLTDPDYFLDDESLGYELPRFDAGKLYRIPSDEREADHLLEALAEATTLVATVVVDVGVGTPVTAGEWAVILYWMPAAS